MQKQRLSRIRRSDETVFFRSERFDVEYRQFRAGLATEDADECLDPAVGVNGGLKIRIERCKRAALNANHVAGIEVPDDPATARAAPSSRFVASTAKRQRREFDQRNQQIRSGAHLPWLAHLARIYFALYRDVERGRYRHRCVGRASPRSCSQATAVRVHDLAAARQRSGSSASADRCRRGTTSTPTSVNSAAITRPAAIMPDGLLTTERSSPLRMTASAAAAANRPR